MRVSEEEAINITIEHGYKGNELDTAVWKQRGCLILNRTQKALISKLETIYSTVIVEGKGKKRIYILKDKKQQLTTRKMNYKGTVASDEDTLMKEYIHGKLIRLQKYLPYAYKSWSEHLGLPKTKDIKLKECNQLIKSKYADYHLLYNPQEIVGGFITEINMRNKAVIQNSFKTLEKENKIDVQTIYQFVADNDESGEIDQRLYDEIQKDLKDYIESIGSSYLAYTQAISNPFKSKYMRGIIKQIKKYLKEKHEVNYIYKSFQVTVLNDKPDVVVSDNEFTQAYYKRFITLTEQRQNRGSYKLSLSVRERFYLYNTLVLLAKLGQQHDLYIHKVEKKLNDNVELYRFDLRKEEYEKKVANHAFGELPKM